MSLEAVVLVHGLWVNGMEMSLLKRRIRRLGYEPLQFSYHSVRQTPRQNAFALNDFLLSIETPVVHFVAHSLGGIILRHLFYDNPQQKPGRVVTLGTPHRPSYAALQLARIAPGRLMLGHSIVDGLLGNVPSWSGTHDLGSIAGSLALGLGMVIPGLPRPNDGTVTVEETRLERMKDHTIISASHFGMLFSSTTVKLCHRFIDTGSFH